MFVGGFIFSNEPRTGMGKSTEKICPFGHWSDARLYIFLFFILSFENQ